MFQRIKVLTILVVFVGLIGGFSFAEGSDGPVAYWSFDDELDPGYDDSGNGIYATVEGGAMWTGDGISRGAMYFDGVDDYLDAGNHPFLDITGDEITLSAWVNFKDFEDYRGIISKSGSSEGYRLLIHS